MLTLSLDAASERLSTLRLQPASQRIATLAAEDETLNAQTSESAFYVLDQDMQIVLAWSSDGQRRIALTGCKRAM